MSAIRRRINRAVESRGFKIESLDWEAVYYAGEMEGYAGGWTLIIDRPYLEKTFPGDEIYGFSSDEILAGIDYWLQPPEPCDCDRSHSAMMAARLKNDPKKPTHETNCKWHIKYRLRWWKES